MSEHLSTTEARERMMGATTPLMVALQPFNSAGSILSSINLWDGDSMELTVSGRVYLGHLRETAEQTLNALNVMRGSCAWGSTGTLPPCDSVCDDFDQLQGLVVCTIAMAAALQHDDIGVGVPGGEAFRIMEDMLSVAFTRVVEGGERYAEEVANV